jgi:hypothetical protein
MELKQFITTTLNDIFDGVAEAQKHAKETGGSINPCSNSEHYSDVDGYWFPVKDVDFDIAVTINEEGKVAGGGGVFTGVITVGTKAESNQTNNQSSRIKFSVPVRFSVDKTVLKKREWGM